MIEKLSNNRLYVILFLILLLSTVFLFFILYINTTRTNTSRVTSEIDVHVNNKQVDLLLKKTGVIDEEQKVKTISSDVEYVPDAINIIFTEQSFERTVIPLHYYTVSGIEKAYGYGIEDTPPEYNLHIYLNPDYLDSLNTEERKYLIESVVIHAALHLAKLREGKPVTGQDKIQLFKQTNNYLNNYNLTDDER